MRLAKEEPTINLLVYGITQLFMKSLKYILEEKQF